MRFVFFGSFRVARDILAGMVANGQLPVAVVCGVDKPVGKKKVITAPAVKSFVVQQKLPIEILQPEKPTDIIPELKNLNADFFVVMGYPHILPHSVISIPPKGTIGVHPSLLPQYRGASPMQSALLAGEAKTGVSLYMMDEKMDHGPLLATAEMTIKPDETNESLEKKIALLAADLLKHALPAFATGTTTLKQQDHTRATFTKKFTTQDAEVDFAKDEPLSIYRKMQALNPEPGVYTFSFPGYIGKRVKLLSARLQDGRLVITQIQPDGKKPIQLTNEHKQA